MIPQYVRQVAPDRRGQQLAGLGARAQSQVGAAVGGLGARMTARGEEMVARGDALAASRAWRQIDEWRIGYLRQLPDRRKDLSASQIHPVSGTNVTGYEMELDAFPNAMAEQMQRVSQGLSASARARLQMSYDDASPRWAQEVATVLDRMEISDVVVEARGLAREGRAASGLDLVDLYRDRLDPDDYEKLTAELRLTGARSDLQEIARFDGWEKARQTLQDPQWQQVYGLDVAEAAAVRNQLAGFVSEEAAIAEVRQKAVADKNATDFLVAAEKGTVDLAAALEMVSQGVLPFAVYEQGKKIMAKPPAERVDDVQTFFEAERWLTKVRQNPAQKAKAIEWLHKNVAQLPVSWKTFASGYEQVGDPEDLRSSPAAKLFDGLLDEHFYKMGTFGDANTITAERAWLDAKLRFARFCQENPTATDEDLRAAYERLTAPVAGPKRGIMEQISRVMLWGMPGGGATLRVLDVRDEAQLAQARQADPLAAMPRAADEPMTRQEFEETVKYFAPGSQAQRDYYGKWAGKWE